MAETVTFAVTGMKCGGCESNVKTQLKSIEGVLSVMASSKENKVEVEFDTKKTSTDSLSKAIVDAGYGVE